MVRGVGVERWVPRCEERRFGDSIAAKIRDVSEQDDDRHLHARDANVGYWQRLYWRTVSAAPLFAFWSHHKHYLPSSTVMHHR